MSARCEDLLIIAQSFHIIVPLEKEHLASEIVHIKLVAAVPFELERIGVECFS